MKRKYTVIRNGIFFGVILAFCLVFIFLNKISFKKHYNRPNANVLKYSHFKGSKTNTAQNSSSYSSNLNLTKVSIVKASTRQIGENIYCNKSYPHVTGSSTEFPGMPDPCLGTRQQSAVEDLLCTKRPDYLPDYKNPCWSDDGSLRCLPYFYLIGVCKAGTTDLFRRLYKHPDLVPNRGAFNGKETFYWSMKRLDEGMTLQNFTEQFRTSMMEHFVDKNGYHYKVTGNGDPYDFWNLYNDHGLPQNVPGAEDLVWTTPYVVRHVIPGIKLLLVLRDPVVRLYSHYCFRQKLNATIEDFHVRVVHSIAHWNKCLKIHSVRVCMYSKQLRSELKVPLTPSFYVVHLQEWLNAFPRSQFYIFRTEDYTRNMSGTLTGIFSFLNVSTPTARELHAMVHLPHYRVTESKQHLGPMMSNTKQILTDLYRPYNEALAELLGERRFAFSDD